MDELQNPVANLELDAKAALGEGPYWDHESQMLLWVDIEQKAVHRFDPHSKANTTIQLDRMVGTVTLDRQGRLVCGVEDGLLRLDHDFQPLEHIPIEQYKTELRLNEGKSDPKGRIFVGSMAKSAAPLAGTFYRMDGDGSIKKVFGNVTISNGLDWSSDERRMYYIDTPTRRVDVFDYDAATGEVQNRRVFLDLSTYSGNPDGMTLDQEGHLWVAFWGAGCVRCFDSSGHMTCEISVPASQVSSVCFGGPHFDTLFITTARTGLTREQLQQEPLAGGLFSVKPGAIGRAGFRCAWR